MLLLCCSCAADDHPVFSLNSASPRHYWRNYSTDVIAEKAVAEIRKAAQLAKQGIPFHLSVAPTACECKCCCCCIAPALLWVSTDLFVLCMDGRQWCCYGTQQHHSHFALIYGSNEIWSMLPS
jgi:hypothetical protein